MIKTLLNIFFINITSGTCLKVLDIRDNSGITLTI